MARVEEPLLESAPLARRVAELLCTDNPTLGMNCFWYHGFWQTLRLLNLVATPEHHADFLRRAFARAAASASRLSVLICGAIDYSTLAHVLWSCELRGVAADVTVVDVCDTPLYLNRWYADRVKAGIRTVRSNILDYQSTESHDVVCTHSFFGQVPPATRPRLMEKWRELLRPGGRAITVNRIRPGSGLQQIGFSSQQARALRDAILRAPQELKDRLGIGAEELARYADDYATRRRPYPVRSREDFVRLFEEGGFTVEYLDCAPVAAPPGVQVGGPTTLDGSEYAQIIARRQ